MKTTLFAVAAVAILAFGAIAVTAQPGKEAREGKEKAQDAKAKMQERCAEFDNETREERCRHLMADGFRARRAGHALEMAIQAHQRIFERVNDTILRLEARIATGELGENATERAEKRLDRLQERQDHLQAKIDKLQAKLETLLAKYQEVRDHVKEVRERKEARGPRGSATEAPAQTTTGA